LCKCLSLLSSVKMLKFTKDRVVMRAYDDRGNPASKMQRRRGRTLGSEFRSR
jgi:type III secretory pathway component EscU